MLQDRLLFIAEDFNYTSVIPVKFEAGITAVAASITIVDDIEVESVTERFTIELVVPNSAKDIGIKAGFITKAMVDILDDDSEYHTCLIIDTFCCM